MAYQYTNIDGARVEVNVASAYQNLKAGFEQAFPGLTLIISSGTRTRAEQAALFDAYNSGRGGLAARPGTSNHEEDGPTGPRALDVRDSGRDAGVTISGSYRAKWLRANASRYGFNPAGYSFSHIEPWHIEFTGSLAGTSPASTTAAPSALIRQVQQVLKTRYPLYGGSLVIDGIYGPKTKAAVVEFQRRSGLVPDGIVGPKTLAALRISGTPAPAPAPKPAPAPSGANPLVRAAQQVLKTRYPLYARHLVVDGIYGPKTRAAVMEFQRRSGLVRDGVIGPKTRAKLGI